jgi:hypothetical protein
MGEPAGEALEIGKHPIAPLAMQLGEGIGEIRCIVHVLWLSPAIRRVLFEVFLEGFQGPCRGDK